MGMIGNQPANNFVSVTKDTFSGNNSNTTFTLSKAATTNGIAVFVNNVRQDPGVAYNVTNNTTLDFGNGNPPSTGTNNIYVLHHNSPSSVTSIDTSAILSSGITVASLTSNGAISGASASFTGDITLLDSDKVVMGTGQDFKIYHDGFNSYITNQNAGAINLTNYVENKDIIFSGNDGGVQKEAGRFDISASGKLKLTEGFEVAANGNGTFLDGAEARFGNGNDLLIFHNGTNSVIKDAGTGNLQIVGSIVQITNSSNNENMIKATQDGAVELYYDAVKKLETTSAGIDVTGTTLTDKLTVSGTGADYIATFQNTTSGTPYGVIIKEPSSAGAGYPLLAITNHDGSTTRFRVDSDTGHIGVNRAPTANDTVHINDTQPIIKLEETSSGGSKMLQLGVESDGTPFIAAPQSGAQIEVQLIGNPEFQFFNSGRFKVTRAGVRACIGRGPVTGVTVNNGSTTSVAGYNGVLHNIVMVSDGSGNGASFAMEYTGGVTKLSGSGNYTNSQNTSSSTNVYKSSSSHAVTLQNNTGSARSYFILILSSYD